MYYNLENIGSRVAQLIKEKGLKKSHICSMNEDEISDSKGKRLSFSRVTLDRIINGTAKPTFPQMLELCDILDVSLDYLIGEDNYKNKQAKAAGEYLGLSSETIEILHNNRYNPSLIFFDYMVRQQPEDIFNLLNQLNSACLYQSEYKLYDTISLSEQMASDEVYEAFLNSFSGLKPSEDKDNAIKLERITIQDTIRDTIERTDPTAYIYYQWQKWYWQDSNSDKSDNNTTMTKEVYEQGLKHFEELHKAYHTEMNKRNKRNKRKQAF